MILITGATGFIGRHLVQQLLDEGRPVRILLPARLQRRPLPWANPPEVITGTLQDDEALFKAVSGAHVIYHLENAQWWGRPRNLERVELVGTRNLIAAARSARVGRIITLSHLGASPASAFMLLKIKGQVEEIIRSSGLAYTIIRSGVVFGEQDAFVNHIAMMMRINPLFFVMPGQGEISLHPIYIKDLVTALVRSLDRIDTIDVTVDIGGAEYITLRDLLQTIMRVTGMYRFIIPVPPYSMRWTTAIYSRILRRSLMTPQWLDLLASNRTARQGNLYEYFGVQPRRFEDTLLTYLPKKSFLLPTLRYSLRRKPREA
ncbi:MAG TPA: NAD(P)H-binding protein [Phototrophicaceae bacterium]|jgi:NADH dehydrogenase|nr:NAD(P)H-binding protein [Phototrophicaceae bacterium]